MNRKLNLGETKVFPGNKLVAYLTDGSEVEVTWGIRFTTDIPKKLYCNKYSFDFYRRWEPCVIKTGEEYYGGITNKTTLLVYAEDYTPILFNNPEEFGQLYQNHRMSEGK